MQCTFSLAPGLTEIFVPIRMNTGVQLSILGSQSGFDELEDSLLQLLEPLALLVQNPGLLVDKAGAPSY
jgi:hypothetical protein